MTFIKKIILCCHCLLSATFLFAQSKEAESIKALVKKSMDIRTTNLDSSVYYATQALILSEANQIDVFMAQIYNQLAIVSSTKADYEQAFKYNHLALDWAEKLQDTLSIIDAHNNIGIDRYYLYDYEKAKKSFENVVKWSVYRADTFKMANAYNNLGLIAEFLGPATDEQAYYLQARDLFAQIKNENGLAMVDLNLGALYLSWDSLSLAKTMLESALGYYQQQKDDLSIVETKIHLVELFWKQNQRPKAIAFAQEALKVAQANGFNNIVIDYLELLNGFYLQLNDYKMAHAVLSELRSLEDSLLNETIAAEIESLSVKYESAQQKQEIATLQVEQQNAENQRNIWVFLSVLVILVSVLLGVLLRTKTHANKIVQKSLAEKETLLKEIHHRVKNNLQIISSLLSLQSRFIKDDQAKMAVNESQNRVKSMALIHQKLYQHDNLTGVEAIDYIQNLTNTLRNAYGVDRDRVEIKYNIDPLNVDVDTIIPLGLILNELISNVFKHAFPDDRSGEICIGLKEENQLLKLEVKDNGIGMKQDISKSDSFGMRMIQSLSQKIEAEVAFDFTHGTVASLTISNYKLV